LANHLFNCNFIFLSNGLPAAAERAVWGVAWPFGHKTLLVEKSSESKFGEYGDQSAENQNFRHSR
jgi:hypothetical protein